MKFYEGDQEGALKDYKIASEVMHEGKELKQSMGNYRLEASA